MLDEVIDEYLRKVSTKCYAQLHTYRIFDFHKIFETYGNILNQAGSRNVVFVTF